MQYLSSYGKKATVLDVQQGGIPNLHYGKMKQICMLKPSQIAKEYGLEEYTTKNGKHFWFRNNNANVLGVFHVDTVKAFRHFRPVAFAEDTRIFCQTLDDRLGGYILLEYLKSAKLNFDILMTTDEEKMASTGLYFGPPKQYNWIFMFDRMGTDAVFYEYGDEQLRYKLGKHGFSSERGSYSCIADMEHLGCKGINFGTGYHNNHDEYAWASRKELYSQLRKFIGFFKEFENVKMPHEKAFTKYVRKYWSHYYENKDELQEKYVVSAEEVTQIETAREKREAQEVVKSKFKESCGCEQCAMGIDCKSFKVEPSEDVAAKERNKPGKKIFKTDDQGNPVGVISDRNIYLLYESINKLSIGSDIKNILRNTYGIKSIWDLCSTSPYNLILGGKLDAPDIDSIDLALDDFGFGIPWNLQGFKHPDIFELERANGYRQKRRVIQQEKPKLPKVEKQFSPKMGVMMSEELLNLEPPKTLDKKTIVMFPTAEFKLPEMIAKAKELETQGYKIHMYAKCHECFNNFEWDFRKTNKAPNSCFNCASKEIAKVDQLELFTMADAEDHLPPDGAGILGLVQLRKDPYDNSSFTFIGKEEGREGVDKYGWVESIPTFEEVGFTIVS